MFKDDDIGLLLNLLHNPYLNKNKRYLPKFEHEDFTPNEGGVIVFGDSFSLELTQSMRMAKDFDPSKTLYFDKRLPSKGELDRVSSNLRLVVFVYVTPHFLLMDKLPYIGGNVTSICNLLADKFTIREIPINEPVLFYSDKERARQYFTSGLSQTESNFTWTDGHRAVMRFYTSSTAPRLSVKIDCGVAL